MAAGSAYSEIHTSYTVSSATLSQGTPVSLSVRWRVNGAFSALAPAYDYFNQTWDRGTASFNIWEGPVNVGRVFVSSQGTVVNDGGILPFFTYVGASFTLYTRIRADVQNNLPQASRIGPGSVLPSFSADFSGSAVVLSLDPDVVVTGTADADAMTHPVIWTNRAGVTASPGSLTKTAASGWNAGAASTRALVSGDGFVEFTATETNATRMAGLSSDNVNTNFSDIDFAIYLHSNATVYVVENGVTRGMFGAYAPGDRFEVGVEWGQVVYRRNGALLYVSGVAPTYPLLVDTALFTPGATLADVGLNGEMGRDITWAAAINTTAVSNTLTKTGASGWNVGAISTRALVSGDGFVDFTTQEANTDKLAGLSKGNTNNDYGDIDFGVLLANNGTFYVFEGGVYRGLFGAYQAGDRFRVAIEGGVVKYRRNGVLFYTSGVLPSYPLLVDTALFSPTSSIADVVLAGDLGDAGTGQPGVGAFAWTAAVHVNPAGNLLTKTGATGWNAGAITTRAIASGDGFVSFTTNETTTHKAIGLSQGNTNTDFSDIDFAILLAHNGMYYVFENGIFRAVFGAYLAGDRFQVAVDGGAVEYLKNGAVFYTSLLTPAYPLLVDTALYSPGATLTDVVLGCVSTACQ